MVFPGDKIFGTKRAFGNFLPVHQTLRRTRIASEVNFSHSKSIGCPKDGTDIVQGADIVSNDKKSFKLSHG